MTDIQSLKQKHPADVSFSGLGVWDVFRAPRQLIGQIVMQAGDPPFAAGDDPGFDYAPGYFFFPAGMAEKDSCL